MFILSWAIPEGEMRGEETGGIDDGKKNKKKRRGSDQVKLKNAI